MMDEEDPLRGLTGEEAERLLEEVGRNEIPENLEAWYKLLAKQFIGPFPLMIEVGGGVSSGSRGPRWQPPFLSHTSPPPAYPQIACVLAAVARKWDDFGIILAMLLLNAAIGLNQEMSVRRARLAASPQVGVG